MRGTIEVVDVKSGTVICERPLNFAQGEQAFNVRGEPRDPAAPENYRIRAYAAICAEIKALGGGKLPTHAWWRCAG